MTKFLQQLIGNDIIATIIMSFVPLIELKGGIVFARSIGLNFFVAFALAYVGSTLVFFPIYFLLKPVLAFVKKIKIFSKIALKIEGYFEKKAVQAIEKQESGKKAVGQSQQNSKTIKSGEYLKKLGVFIFVAIPLPVTGVWTGTAIAVFLGLKFKNAFLPIILGNAVAGMIISLLAELCIAVWSLQALDYILYGLFALAVILLIVVIFKIAKSKPKQE